MLRYLKKNGFELVEGSANRLTLTVRGTRAEAERALEIRISDYRIGDKIFYANEVDPLLPKAVAQHVGDINGLNNLATPQPIIIKGIGDVFNALGRYISLISRPINIVYQIAVAAGVKPAIDPPPPAWQGVDGTGQTIGLLQFDTFNVNDVIDYIQLIGLPPSTINNLTLVHVNGGAGALPGPHQDEVLLDIDNVLSIAPGAKIRVYDAPFNGTTSGYVALFNAMIADGVDIISNSWASCEDQVSLADAQGIDTVLQTAAAAGISVFNATGDSGSTCLDGSPNTITVPADSPNATAVGGTTLTLEPGFTYGNETWWNGATDTPPSGQGGFGTSKFFSRPAYQNGLNAMSKRSVPDVVVNADPTSGALICAKSLGGCPTGLYYGGTSSSAPIWAAFTALLNQSQGSNLGTLNPLLYPLANTDSFHHALAIGSDFAHVGLGSPNLARLHQVLTSQLTGTVSTSVSQVGVEIPSSLVWQTETSTLGGVPADGLTKVAVVVRLADGNGNVIIGHNVALTINGGSATITPTSGVTTVDNGAVVFYVTDLTPETLTFTATDTTSGIVLDQKPSITFVTPPAANAGINAFPTPVTADGVSATTITLTLKDALGRPTPGKLVTLAQNGHSVISGPTPQITDNNGQIQFAAVDQFPETVTYTATDVTDGNLAFPGTGTVTFSGGIANGCGNGNPTPGPGFLVKPYATGFVAQNFFYGNINFGGCPGATGMAFDDSGNLYVADGPTGNIYKLPPDGGVANSITLLTSTPLGPSLSGMTFDKNGNLFVSRYATTGDFFTGAVMQINPSTGAVIRTVASNLTCPGTLSIDPLSGDLFTTDTCGGGGSENPSLWRIADPGGPSPVTSVYAILPGPTNATVAFAPSGTMYVWSFTGANTQVVKVSGTNGPSTPAVSVVPGLSVSYLGLLAEGTQANGDADFLVLNFPPQGNIPGGTGMVDLTSNPPSLSRTLITDNGGANKLTKGPDGCIYAAQGNAVFKITDTSGACNYSSTPPAPTIMLSPTIISPNPVQGNPETFTASLHYVPAPTGTPVLFTVTGANPQIKQVRSDASGQASFTYTAVNSGKDTISASATVNDSTATSNPVPVTWAAGEHVTFLTLNLSPAGGTANQPVTVTASLTDVSANPAAALANQNVDFILDSASCSATTDAKGIASCSITPIVLGTGTLTAHFSGTNQLTPANASIGFNTMAVAVEPSPTVTISVNPTTVAPGVISTLTWSSTGATSCLASGAWNGSQSTSGNQSVSQALSGTYTYTLACNGPGGPASNSASLIVKPIACDINRDGDVDRDDINQITAARNQIAAPGDPRDFDNDGRITVKDARACTLLCTRSLCATN